MSKSTGGPAFPGKQDRVMIPVEMSEKAHSIEVECNGMTLRDYFAAKAPEPPETWRGGDRDAKSLAIWAYQYADEMLKARTP